MSTLASRIADKVAKDLPKDVERYVDEGIAQGLPESEAWAVAWSRWCKYKMPGDEHCRKDPEEYLKKASQTVVARFLKAMDNGQAGPSGTFLEIDLRKAPF